MLHIMIIRIIRTLKTTALVALVTLLIAECVLRATMLMSWSSPSYVADADIGYRIRPASSYSKETMNAFGFNDVDHSDLKAKDVTRLAIVGDSFVFGVVPRAANLTAVVQRLAHAADEKIEVLNMGIPGAGPKNYRRLIGKDTVDRQADIVCVVLFVGNDVIQAHPDFDTRLWLGDAREVLVRPYAVGWSAEYLTLYRFWRASSRMLRERLSASRDGTFSRQTFLEIERQRAVIFETVPSKYVRDSYASLIDIARKMVATAQAHNIKFFVVLAPDEIQVERSLQNELAQSFRLDPSDHDFDELPRNLARDLEAIGIPTLNLLPLFQDGRAVESLYAKQDTHWNEVGNAVAGEAIWRFMQRRVVQRTDARP